MRNTKLSAALNLVCSVMLLYLYFTGQSFVYFIAAIACVLVAGIQYKNSKKNEK